MDSVVISPESDAQRLVGEDAQLDWGQVRSLVTDVIKQIGDSGWSPNLIVGLSRGGFIPATMIALGLGVHDVVGLDVYKNADGTRSIGRFAALNRLDGHTVLIVDDGIVTGNLLPMTAEHVRTLGGQARTAALVSEGKCPTPDYLAATLPPMPVFPWES